MTRPNAALLYMPYQQLVWSLNGAVPQLTSWMEKAGYDVLAVDVNLELLDLLGWDDFHDPEMTIPARGEATLRMAIDSKKNPYFKWFDKLRLVKRLMGYPLIGMSCSTTEQLLPAMTLAFLLEVNGYDGLLVLGGTALDALPYPALSEVMKFFHLGVYGPGEEILLRLVRALKLGRTPASIVQELALSSEPNLVFTIPDKSGFKHVTVSANRENSFRLSDQPGPAYTRKILKEYAGLIDGTLDVPVIAGRGCYWGKCAFCAYPSTCTVKAPEKTVEQAIAVWEVCHDFDAQIQLICDAMAPTVVGRIADLMLKKAPKGIKWTTFMRVDAKGFPPALCEKLAKAGCTRVFVGVETLSDRISDLMNKGSTPEQRITACRNLREAGVHPMVGIIGDYVNCKYADLEESLERLETHAAKAFWDIIPCKFSLDVGSPMSRNPEAYNIELHVKPKDDWNWTRDFAYIPYRPKKGSVDWTHQENDRFVKHFFKRCGELQRQAQESE